MSDYRLNIPFNAHNRELVKQCMATAHAMRDHGLPPWRDDDAKYQWWVERFGASEDELNEICADIARQYRQTRFWQGQRRKELMDRYIRFDSMIVAGQGLDITWI